MSLNIFLFITFGLLSIIDESESIRCYDCSSSVDGEKCITASSLREKECPDENYCYKISGYGKKLREIFIYFELNFCYSYGKKSSNSWLCN